MMNRLSSPATLAMALLMTLPMACGDDGGGGGGNGNTDGGNNNGIDGGNNNGAVDANPNAPRTAYRVSKLVLIDPHVFALGDTTGTVNNQIRTAVETDDDDPADGILDLNVSVIFQPLDQSGSSTPMFISFADCVVPFATTSCTETAASTVIAATATNSSSGTCLEALAGTTTAAYDPVVPVPSPCFSSNAVDVTVDLGTVTLPLKSARISATYSGTPATSLVTGLLMGFLTEADAMNIIVPIPVVEDRPLSDILEDTDMDTGPNGETGWWFYLSVEAVEVPYTSP